MQDGDSRAAETKAQPCIGAFAEGKQYRSVGLFVVAYTRKVVITIKPYS